MTYTMLVSTEELSRHLDDPSWLVVDCRFTLLQPGEKEAQYLQAHIPGAIYAHLDRDLSEQVIPGQTGRHPLPSPEEAARRFGRMGIGAGIQVVAYDDMGGSLAAVRLWLMLRWLGHPQAAVLDGGWQKWLEEGRATQAGQIKRPPADFIAQPRADIFVDSEQVERVRLDPNFRLIDVRARERYTGEIEPIDPVAGHIPGALSVPYMINLTEDGRFQSPEFLREHYQSILNGAPAGQVVFYCGSGVTSIHSYLALMIAGMGEARIYPGSWSEWIATRRRPVKTGPDAS